MIIVVNSGIVGSYIFNIFKNLVYFVVLCKVIIIFSGFCYWYVIRFFMYNSNYGKIVNYLVYWELKVYIVEEV